MDNQTAQPPFVPSKPESGGALPNQPPNQPVNVAPPNPISAPNKEQLVQSRPAETVPVVELGKDRELEPEVEGWLDQLKQEGEIKLPEPIKDDQGNVIMAEAPVQVVNDKIIVPMTQASMKQGLKKPVTDSARWLSEWISRLFKMFGAKVAFKKSE